MLTQDFVKELFDYSNGILHWKKSNNKKIKVGSKAGSLHKNGYVAVRINGKPYQAHRVIFLMHNGYIPEFIDHINNVRNDNRIENLRPATAAQNNRNSKTPVTNTSGSKGIIWDKNAKKWRCQVVINKISKHIGCFSIFEEAKNAVQIARLKLHGEFANHGDRK